MNDSSSVGVAVALVRPMSPPLPGSDVIVPHCSPAAALANTSCRCSSHGGWRGSGLNSQNAMTDGCIADTRATDGSAVASRRSTSHTGRADDGVSRHRPPAASGTTALQKPRVAELVEVVSLERSTRLTLATLRLPRLDDRPAHPREATSQLESSPHCTSSCERPGLRRESAVARSASNDRCHASVDVQDLTIDVARCVAREEHDGSSKLIDASPTACRRSLGNPAGELLISDQRRGQLLAK